jgi:Coenzyme PQQ synthesis protein D (PqqD)
MMVRYQRTPSVLFAELGTDVVALEVNLGYCFGMEDGTAAIWNLLGSPIGIDEIVERLTQSHEVKAEACRRDVERIIGQLEQEGLVTAVTS